MVQAKTVLVGYVGACYYRFINRYAGSRYGGASMRAIRAIYDKGQVKLLEHVSLKDKQEVTVLVPDEGESSDIRVLRFAGMLSDLSPQEEAAFDEALQRKLEFKR